METLTGSRVIVVGLPRKTFNGERGRVLGMKRNRFEVQLDGPSNRKATLLLRENIELTADDPPNLLDELETIVDCGLLPPLAEQRQKRVVFDVATSNSGMYIACATPDGVEVYDVSTNMEVAITNSTEEPGTIKSLTFSHRTTAKIRLAVCGKEAVFIYTFGDELRTCMKQVEVLRNFGTEKAFDYCVFSPCENYIAACGLGVSIFSLTGEDGHNEGFGVSHYPNEIVQHVAFSPVPDVYELAVALEGIHIIKWKEQEPVPVLVIDIPWGSVRSVSYSPNGNNLLFNNTLSTQVYTFSTDSVTQMVFDDDESQDAPLRSLRKMAKSIYSPDGCFILSTGLESHVEVYNIRSKQRKKIEIGTRPCADFSPCGNYLVAARIFNEEDGFDSCPVQLYVFHYMD